MFDWTILLLLLSVVITGFAQIKMSSAFSKYSKIPSKSGITGAETARQILHANGIFDVQVVPVAGNLTDHYNPKTKTVSLSQSIYNASSIAAIGVAAHECGHAIQDSIEYAPLRFRAALVPVVNIGSRLAWPLILIGVIFSHSQKLIDIGIVLFSLTVVFQLITLPVEFNASGRALCQIKELGLVPSDENKGMKKVLSAAAMTYVAAALASILQLLRLIALFGGRRRD